MGFVFGLVIGRVEVVDAGAQTSLHDGEVLVGQGEIHHDVGAETLKEGDQLLYVVGIDLRSLDGLISYCFDNGVAL